MLDLGRLFLLYVCWILDNFHVFDDLLLDVVNLGIATPETLSQLDAEVGYLSWVSVATWLLV